MASVAALESAIDTVTAAVASLGTDVTEVLTLLQNAQQNGDPIPQDAIDKLTAISSNLTTMDASLKAVEHPPTT